MKTKIILTTLLCIAALMVTRAQSTIEDLNFEMVTIPENDPYAELGPDSFPLPRHAPTILVDIDNTEEVVRIHSRIGTSSGEADIAEKVFDFNTAGIFEDGTIFSVQGNRASLYFGSFYHQATYYMQVRLERPDGSFTVWEEISAE